MSVTDEICNFRTLHLNFARKASLKSLYDSLVLMKILQFIFTKEIHIADKSFLSASAKVMSIFLALCEVKIYQLC